MRTPKKDRPNSRKGIPNGKSKHYGDRDQRFRIDAQPEEVLSRLLAATRPDTADQGE